MKASPEAVQAFLVTHKTITWRKRKFHSKYPETSLQPKASCRKQRKCVRKQEGLRWTWTRELSQEEFEKKKWFVCSLNERTTGRKAGALWCCVDYLNPFIKGPLESFQARNSIISGQSGRARAERWVGRRHVRHQINGEIYSQLLSASIHLLWKNKTLSCVLWNFKSIKWSVCLCHTVSCRNALQVADCPF